ncbi:MAG: SMC-Scp complex subunit ScpB [Bacillota bacterium]
MECELQKKIIEALLFLKEDPVKNELIADVLSIPREEAADLVRELQSDLAAAGRGIQIYEVAGGYQMGTLPELASYLERSFTEDGSGSLSQAAMETLSIIAYRQPVTRVDVESIRGVKCEHVLENLLKRKLIRICGRKEGPGRPLIYSTTTEFLKYFGLKELPDLPPLEEERD